MRANAGPGRLLTASDVESLGLDAEEPPSPECPYCGAPLEPLAVELDGRAYWVSHRDCGCEGERSVRERREAEERRERRRELLGRLTRAGIGRRYLDAQVSVRSCADYLAGFADSRGGGLYIYGPVGSGKTHEASALAARFVEAGYTVVMTGTLRMLDSVYASCRSDSERAAGLSRYSTCDVLILDDLGKEGASGWAGTTLYQIVDARYNAMLPIIVTSQYPPQSIERRLARGGEAETAAAIASRLAEMCEPVPLAHRDRRRCG